MNWKEGDYPMECHYKLYDSKEGGLYIGVSNHYFKRSDAKKVYRESLERGNNDDSVLFEISTDKSKEEKVGIYTGVDEAEQFALALLNLCNSIKR